jgi:hypothetical protein
MPGACSVIPTEAPTLSGGEAVKIVREDLPRSERLASETPRSSAVRITGTLDTISASSGTILIVLPDGHRVQARLDTPDPELLRALFGKLVTISGMARFGLSGRLLIVDARVSRSGDAERRHLGTHARSQPRAGLASVQAHVTGSVFGRGCVLRYLAWRGIDGRAPPRTRRDRTDRRAGTAFEKTFPIRGKVDLTSADRAG